VHFRLVQGISKRSTAGVLLCTGAPVVRLGHDFALAHLRRVHVIVGRPLRKTDVLQMHFGDRWNDEFFGMNSLPLF
jgi:hypothetical protein